jgi:heme A synthase
MATQDAAAAGPHLPARRVTEHQARFLPGLRMLVLGIAALLAGVTLLVVASHHSHGAAAALIVLCVLIFTASAPGSPVSRLASGALVSGRPS